MIKSLLELDWVIMATDIAGQSYRLLCHYQLFSLKKKLRESATQIIAHSLKLNSDTSQADLDDGGS